MKNSPTVTACSADEYTAALAALPESAGPVSFLQAPFYGAWQTADGKTVAYFTARDGDETVAAGLAVKYDAPGGISFLYCPYGPLVANWTPDLFNALKDFFAGVAKHTGAAFIRFDNYPDGVRPAANKLAATASLQPRAEWLLDISGPQDDIWMGMYKHARYNVRLGERAGAKLEFFAPSKAPLDIFFDLMNTTAGRDSFSIQSRRYYQAALSSIPADAGFVALCHIDGKPAATALFAAYDGVMHYVFAGSSNDFRKIAPPYFVIWNAIIEAKKRGWVTLNFGGVTDGVKGAHLSGVTGFKKRFGGYRQTHPNPADLVYRPFKYRLFSLYKRLHG